MLHSRPKFGDPSPDFDPARGHRHTCTDAIQALPFRAIEADPASGELLRQGVRVRVQDQPFRLLTILLECPCEVVSR